jgi:hypothetical protein
MLDSAPIVVFDAGVAKQAYAQDLKSCGPKGPYRFDPGLRHHALTLYGDRDFMPFGVAAVVALKYPLVGLGICISCLIVYLKPDPPGAVDRYCTDRPD